MIEIALSRCDKIAIIDDDDAELATWKWSGYKSPRAAGTYAGRATRRNDKRHTLYLARVVASRMGFDVDGMVVDHMNGDTLDNRRANLRVVSQSENARNIAGPRSNNTSGYVGVSYRKETNKYRAWICVEAELIHLGQYDTAEDAYKVRLEAERKLWGIHPRRAEAHAAA